MVSALGVLAAALLGGLDGCRTAYDSLRYAEAAKACQEAAIAAPDSDRVLAYELWGISLAAVGDATQARQVFASLLALAPETRLAADLSPKLRQPFEAVLAGARPVVLRASAAADGDKAPTVEVTVDDGPNRPVRTLELDVGDRRTARPRDSEHTHLELPAPPPAGTRAVVRALDFSGGELARTSVELMVARPAGLSAVWWKVLAGCAIGFGGAGAGLTLYARDQYDRARSAQWADDADRLRGSADLSRALGLGAAAVAGAFTLAAAITFGVSAAGSGR